MPIEGPLRELAPADLLQLIYLSRRTGLLRVDGPGDAYAVVSVQDGELTSATSSNPERRLGWLLSTAGRLTTHQVEEAIARQATTRGRRIGEILVTMGAIGVTDVERQLAFQIEETIFDLLRWNEGYVSFTEIPPENEPMITIRMRADTVLMDAIRRLDELEEVFRTGAGADPLPRLAPPGPTPATPLSLQPFEWEVLAEVDGHRTLRMIARELGRGELEVARALYALASAKVVDLGESTQEGGA